MEPTPRRPLLPPPTVDATARRRSDAAADRTLPATLPVADPTAEPPNTTLPPPPSRPAAGVAAPPPRLHPPSAPAAPPPPSAGGKEATGPTPVKSTATTPEACNLTPLHVDQRGAHSPPWRRYIKQNPLPVGSPGCNRRSAAEPPCRRHQHRPGRCKCIVSFGVPSNNSHIRKIGRMNRSAVQQAPEERAATGTSKYSATGQRRARQWQSPPGSRWSTTAAIGCWS